MIDKSLNRRNFLKNSAIAGTGLSFIPALTAFNRKSSKEIKGQSLHALSLNLLKRWCDGLVHYQLQDLHSKRLDGGLICPACSAIHGRSGDGIYPLLFMAEHTGDNKYLEAALALYSWMENNVSYHDGSWINEINVRVPWKSTTVFGCISLAESIYYHGDILDKLTVDKWKNRLKRAGDYIYKTIYVGYANINYPITFCYAMALLGKLFNESKYTQKARETANELMSFFTENDKLIFGEGRPYRKKSPKGLLPVDLGYNVEESLPALVLYAKLMKDEKVMSKTIESLHSHAEFMLPDGAWDNSWGTRNFKWTYWGSRTSDGCQPAYALLADKFPVFYQVAYKNTMLLYECTQDGLLHGGPHYLSHGISPCIHHTFCHAKALAGILNHTIPETDVCNVRIELPRSKEYGVKTFSDIQTFLISKGGWRATITGYDREYYMKNGHATGGALSMLWHSECGPVLCASMNKYQMEEPHSMQRHNDPNDIPLTPRLEFVEEDRTYMNISDLGAKISWEEKNGVIHFKTLSRLVDQDQNNPPIGEIKCEIMYRFEANGLSIEVKTIEPPPNNCKYIIPVISKNDQKVDKSASKVEIRKKNGKIIISSNPGIELLPAQNGRIFNYVPGLEALPLAVNFDASQIIQIKLNFNHQL